TLSSTLFPYTTLFRSKDKAAWWNQGIAATALGRWGLARRAWAGFGIDLPAGEGPLDFPCGSCPVRLCPDGDAEVVWAHRIDPARSEEHTSELQSPCNL